MKKITVLKQGMLYLICAAVIISSPATASAGNGQTAVEATGEQPPSLRKEIQKLKKGNWVNLTTQQKLEDLDILYQTLKDNYPYFHVLKRMRNVDLEEKYRTARTEISRGGTDIAFYQLLDAFINTNDQIGHLMLDNPYWFPGLPLMNQDDLSDVDLFHEIEYITEPSGKEKMLKGKLWLLVSDTVFSSSEYAAIFSKATGFMTLVGTRTGGEGIGSDPLPILLPNSGLIVQYAAEYGALPDGSGSQEYGTMPDILSSEGESALDTCLRAIGQDQRP